MGQKSLSPRQPSAPPRARHALEAAEAGSTRIAGAVHRVAARIAAALAAAPEEAARLLRFEIADIAIGRRDEQDALFVDAGFIAAITLDPVHVPALIIADASLPGMLVERQYGGRIEALGTARLRAPGRAETREFIRLAEAMASALQHSCDDRLPVTTRLVAPLDPADARGMIAAGEAVAAIGLDVALPPLATTQRLSLLLPVAALRASSALQATLTPRDAEARRRWQQALAQRVGDVAMPARSVIARPLLSMGQLMALRPGDVIPIGMPRHVPLLVADRQVATGTIGERDGRVAFMINRLEQEDAR